jgi:hypothetical protein
MTTSAKPLELDNITPAAQRAVCPGLIDLMKKLLTTGKQHFREGNHEETLSCAKRAQKILVLSWIAKDTSTLQKIRGPICIIQTAAYFNQAAVLQTEERADWEREGFTSARNGISILGQRGKLGRTNTTQLLPGSIPQAQ